MMYNLGLEFRSSSLTSSLALSASIVFATLGILTALCWMLSLPPVLGLILTLSSTPIASKCLVNDTHTRTYEIIIASLVIQDVVMSLSMIAIPIFHLTGKELLLEMLTMLLRLAGFGILAFIARLLPFGLLARTSVELQTLFGVLWCFGNILVTYIFEHACTRC